MKNTQKCSRCGVVRASSLVEPIGICGICFITPVDETPELDPDAQCAECGRIWSDSDMDENGRCPECVQQIEEEEDEAEREDRILTLERYFL